MEEHSYAILSCERLRMFIVQPLEGLLTVLASKHKAGTGVGSMGQQAMRHVR